MTSGQILQRLLILVLAAAATGSGCKATPESAAGKKQQATSESLNTDALLAGATQRQPDRENIDHALSLVKKATERSPDRADITWLYSQLCAQAAGCQPEASESRLRKLDPGNAAAWLNALARARQRNDVAAESEILDAMGRCERFDIYWNSLVSHTARAMSMDTAYQLGPNSPDILTTNLNDAIGWLSAVLVPGFDTLGDTCNATRLANPIMAERCRKLAGVLQKGDSYIAEGVGLGILQRLAPSGSPQATVVATDIQRSRYQRDTAGQIIASQVERDKFSRELVKLMSTLHREQDVYLAVIRWAGMPVEPGTGDG